MQNQRFRVRYHEVTISSRAIPVASILALHTEAAESEYIVIVICNTTTIFIPENINHNGLKDAISSVLNNLDHGY